MMTYAGLKALQLVFKISREDYQPDSIRSLTFSSKLDSRKIWRTRESGQY